MGFCHDLDQYSRACDAYGPVMRVLSLSVL
jgi:hypothetical protein